RGLEMTYCCGILVRDGLVMIADTRTNAGLDNVSTFRKLHIFSKPGDRIMAIASAGNLAVSQSVLSTLTEGLEDPNTGEIETLMNAPTMFQAAQRIGRAIRAVHATEGPALRSEDVSFDVSFLFGGQISGARLRLRGRSQPPHRGGGALFPRFALALVGGLARRASEYSAAALQERKRIQNLTDQEKRQETMSEAKKIAVVTGAGTGVGRAASL